MQVSTLNRDRALELLGCGLPQATVAASLGVTEGFISQLLTEPDFARAVGEKKYATQVKNNERDNRYDKIEDQLLDQLEGSICMLLKPMELIKATQVINSLKRRGVSAPDQVVQQQTLVQITLPAVAAPRFVTDINNQVTKAGSQELETIQSHTLAKQFKMQGVPDAASRTIEVGNTSTRIPTIASASLQAESNLDTNISFVQVGS